MNNTLSNGLRILELLAHADGELGVHDVARQLSLGASNAHRLLKTLSETGFVKQSPESRKYALTLKLWTLGSQEIARWDVKEIGSPHLRELAEGTDETVHLSILQDMNVLYIDKIDSQHPIRAYTQVGGHAPAYCVSTGKALLAFTPGAGQALAQLQFRRYTSRTIASHDALLKELEKIRSAGYAINMGEWREGVRGVAAPVYDSRAEVVCAIGLTGPAARLTVERLHKYSAKVKRVANAMSMDMGMPVAADAYARR